jgi:CspA family cold shock protein
VGFKYEQDVRWVKAGLDNSPTGRGGLVPGSSARIGGKAVVSEREMGTVKWFSDAKGYGFIERPAGDDVFVHYSGIRGQGHRTLREGQRVEFNIVQEPKGPRANDVTVMY